jgi:hypothetical protein
MPVFDIKEEITSRKLPSMKVMLGGGALLLVLAWLAWFFFWPKPVVAPPQFTKALPAHQVGGVAKVAGPVLSQPLKVVPRAVVRRALPDLPIDESEEVIDTAEVPRAPYGATTVTKIDQTGLATTYVKANERPFFEFKKELEIGGGADINLHGERSVVLEGRFVPLRIGSMHLAVKAEGVLAPEAPRDRQLDGRVGIRLFGRFD